jgi:hypothetical protein
MKIKIFKKSLNIYGKIITFPENYAKMVTLNLKEFHCKLYDIFLNFYRVEILLKSLLTI